MLVQRDKDILRFIEDHGGITIAQCAKTFFKDSMYGYDLARKRLKKMYDMGGILKFYKNKATDERVYYTDNKISSHKVYLMNFFCEMLHYDCAIFDFKKEPRYLDGKVRGDGFFYFTYNGKKRILIVEVDLTHQTDLNKWEKVYDEGEIQKQYNDAFPMIVVISDKEVKYTGNKLTVVSLDYKLSKFVERVLNV